MTKCNIRKWGTVLCGKVRVYRVLLTVNCEVKALDKSVVETNVDFCVGEFRWWCFSRFGDFALWCLRNPAAPLFTRRPESEIQITEGFRLHFGVDNSQSCALLLADPTSFGPDFGRFVGDPLT